MEVFEPITSSVNALKTRLHSEQGFQERPCLIRESDGTEIGDNEVVGDLAECARLICITSASISTLESRVAKLDSPGCKYQKYLRWLEGTPAGDPRILQTAWAASILPMPFALNSSKDAGGDDADDDAGHDDDDAPTGKVGLDEVSAAVLHAIDASWGARRRQSQACESDAVEVLDRTGAGHNLQRQVPVTTSTAEKLSRLSWEALKQALMPHYDADAHAKLLKSVLGGSNDGACTLSDDLDSGDCKRSDVLRTLLAECDQIMCRDTKEFVKKNVGTLELCGHGRQQGAYQSLLKVASCTRTRLWA